MTSKKIKVTRWQCKCNQCDRDWLSRTEDKPTICPYCKSVRWDKPKRETK